MIKIVVVVLCYFCCIFRVSSAPIIKTSGIQWSEPKGTGKGNITLIMVPQGYSSSNDSDDMIVAVKSDYQIVSQDTQLLNLIVNERQNDESNLTHYDSDFRNCVNSKHNEPNSKIKHLNTAKYFESKVGNIPLEIKNHSSISSDPLDGEDKNSIPRREDKKANYADEMQLFEFLKMTTPSGDIPETDKNKLNVSHTTETLKHLYRSDEYLNNTPSLRSSINVYQLLLNLSGSNTDKDQFDKNNLDYHTTEKTNNVSNVFIRTNPTYVLNHSDKTNEQFSTAHTESTLDIFKFLNIIDTKNNNVNLLDVSSVTSTESTIDLFAFLNNAMESRSEKKNLNTKLFQGNNDNTKFSTKMPSKESFLNEALTIIDNLKQNPSYYKNELNGDFHSNIRNEREQKQPKISNKIFKDLKDDDLALATDDDEILAKEFQCPGVYIKDISNIEENSGINKISTPDICESFFIIDDNQTHNSMQFTSPSPGESVDKLVLTFEKSANNETDKGSGTLKPSDGDNAMSNSEKSLPELSSVVSQTTLADIGSSIAVTQSSMTEEKSSPILMAITNPVVKPSDTTYLNEQNNSPTPAPTEIKSETTTQAYGTDQPNISPGTDICTKIIIVPCISTKSNEVFGKISDMIADKNESPKIKSSEGGSPQKGKQAILKKITLEPKDECETIFGAKIETHTTQKPIEDSNVGGQLEDNDLKLPLEGSPVFLYNNNERLREFDIPTDINSSLIKLRLTGLHGKRDHMIERVAEAQNNNHLVINALKKPTEVKTSSKNTVVTKSSIPVKEKDLNSVDVNKILKIHFAGKNEVLKQKLRTNVDVEPEKNCEPTPEIENFSEIEPDDEDLESSPSEITVTQNIKDHVTQTSENIKTTKLEMVSQIKTTNQLESSEQKEIHDTTSILEETSLEYHLSTELQETKSQIKTTTKQHGPSDQKDIYDISTSSPLEETTFMQKLSTESLKTKSQIKTTTNQLESSSEKEIYGISTLSSLEETSMVQKSSTELQLEESSEFLSTRKVTQKILPSSTKSSANENSELQTAMAGKTTKKKLPLDECEDESTEPKITHRSEISFSVPTKESSPTTRESPINESEEESTESQISLPATITTQRSPLSKEYDSNTDGLLHTQNNIAGKGNTKKYEPQSKEINYPTEISTEQASPRTSLDLKPKSKPDQTCEKSVYIPSNSVKEVVIQIVRYTKKPGKHTSDSISCYGARGDKKHVVDTNNVERTVDEMNNREELDISYDGNVIRKTDSKYSNSLLNMEEPRLTNHKNQVGSFEESNTGEQGVTSKKVFSNAEEFINNDQEYSQQKILNKPYKNTAGYSEKKFSNGIFEHLTASDSEIKHI